MDLATKRVLVTGGGGFLGSFVLEQLRQRGVKHLEAPRSNEFDLRERDAIEAMYRQLQPQVVIHLAAVVGGIEANRAYPGRFFYDNAMMGLQLIEHGRRLGVEKFVALGTICAYPKFTPVPFKEDTLWDGYPEETNAPYGLAKKMMLVQLQGYRQEYDFNGIYLLPVNLYGPRDNFDLNSSHVIPALIRKCVEARDSGAESIVCWGDGSPTREFLYVEDAAEGIVLAAERYEGNEPINLGTGQEISIRDLVELVVAEVGFEGQVEWDTSKPNGQPRRCLDTERAAEEFGFKARTDFALGLKKTVRWFIENKNNVREVEYG